MGWLAGRWYQMVSTGGEGSRVIHAEIARRGEMQSCIMERNTKTPTTTSTVGISKRTGEGGGGRRGEGGGEKRQGGRGEGGASCPTNRRLVMGPAIIVLKILGLSIVNIFS